MAESPDIFQMSDNVEVVDNLISNYSIQSTNATFCPEIKSVESAEIPSHQHKRICFTKVPPNTAFALNTAYRVRNTTLNSSKNVPHKISNASTQTEFTNANNYNCNPAVLQNFLIKQFSQINTRLDKIENMIKSKKFLDIGIPLPITTVEGIDELEMKLADDSFKNLFMEYVKKIHGKDKDYARILKHLFSDSLFFEFNWHGEKGKRSLKHLKIFSVILFEAIGEESLAEYEKEVKIVIKRTHQRFLKKKS